MEEAVEAAPESEQVARPRPEVVPAGVRLPPIVARPAPARQYRLDHFAERYVPIAKEELKYPRDPFTPRSKVDQAVTSQLPAVDVLAGPGAHLDLFEDDQPEAIEPNPELVTSADDSRSLPRTVGSYWEAIPYLTRRPLPYRPSIRARWSRRLSPSHQVSW
ncbi:hypothetical protein ACWDBD_43085 [Streptomyces sp. NPDC001118]